MKSLCEYILEATTSGSENDFFKDIFDNIKDLDDAIVIDSNELKRINDGVFDADDVTDANFQKLTSSKQVGITNSLQIIKNDSLLIYDDKNNKYEPIYMPFITNIEGKDFFVGMIIFDVKSVILKNYINIINIESAKYIKNDKDACKGMFLNFCDFIMETLKNKDIRGVCARLESVSVSPILRACGMKTFTKDKRYLIYEF